MGRRLTTEEFIAKAKKVHGNDYDYSQVKYVNRDWKVTIICPTHGPFEQSPDRHLYGNSGKTKGKSRLKRKGYGCPQCEQYPPIDTTEFIRRAIEKHGQRYEYSRVNYRGMSKHVIITCRIHGDFKQTPHNHLRGNGGLGHNCPLCSRMKRWAANNRRSLHGSSNINNSNNKKGQACPLV